MSRIHRSLTRRSKIAQFIAVIVAVIAVIAVATMVIRDNPKIVLSACLQPLFRHSVVI